MFSHTLKSFIVFYMIVTYAGCAYPEKKGKVKDANSEPPTIHGHEKLEIKRAMFGPGDEQILLALNNGKIYLYETATGKLAHSIALPDSFYIDDAYYPEGDYIVVKCYKRQGEYFYIWNPVTGYKNFLPLRKNKVPYKVEMCADFSKAVVKYDGGETDIISMPFGTELLTLYPDKTVIGSVRRLSWAIQPGQRYFFVQGPYDTTLVYDFYKKGQVYLFSKIGRAEFSPGGEFLIVEDSTGLKKYETRNWQVVSSKKMPPDAINSMEHTRDGDLLVETKDEITKYNTVTWTPVYTRKLYGNGHTACIDFQQRAAISYNDNDLYYVRLDSALPPTKLSIADKGEWKLLTFTNDGKTAAWCFESGFIYFLGEKTDSLSFKSNYKLSFNSSGNRFVLYNDTAKSFYLFSTGTKNQLWARSIN